MSKRALRAVITMAWTLLIAYVLSQTLNFWYWYVAYRQWPFLTPGGAYDYQVAVLVLSLAVGSALFSLGLDRLKSE